MRKNNKGIALVNVILVVFIILCSLFIGLILKSEDVEVANEEYNKVKRNVITRENQTVASNEYVELSNNIGGGVTQTRNEGKDYYYRQLNNAGKKMYDELVKNIDSFKNGSNNIELDVDNSELGDYFQSVWDAFCLDRPDIFWVDTLKLSLVTKTTSFFGAVKYQYSIQPQENTNSYFLDSFKSTLEVENAINKVESRINQIAGDASGNTYDKVKYVHDTIVESIEYDQTGTINNANLYGALIERNCVCEGYAEALKIILDKLNIPCVIVYGEGIDGSGGSEAHAWNYVKMENGNWYAIDPTWDDPIIIGGGSVFGVNKHKYFLKGSNEFFQTHIEDGNVSGRGQVFEYPTISTVDY